MRLHKKLANTVRPNKKRLKMHSEVGKDRASLEKESMTKTVHLVAPFNPYFPLFLRDPALFKAKKLRNYFGQQKC